MIIKAVMEYAGEATVTAESGHADLRSVMQLMSLGLEQGTDITIRVSGPDEQGWANKLVELFETHFDFPPRDPSSPQVCEEIGRPLQPPSAAS